MSKRKRFEETRKGAFLMAKGLPKDYVSGKWTVLRVIPGESDAEPSQESQEEPEEVGRTEQERKSKVQNGHDASNDDRPCRNGNNGEILANGRDEDSETAEDSQLIDVAALFVDRKERRKGEWVEDGEGGWVEVVEESADENETGHRSSSEAVRNAHAAADSLKCAMVNGPQPPGSGESDGDVDSDASKLSKLKRKRGAVVDDGGRNGSEKRRKGVDGAHHEGDDNTRKVSVGRFQQCTTM